MHHVGILYDQFIMHGQRNIKLYKSVLFINLILVKNLFFVLVVSDPESPAACVDAPAYIPVTPHYY